MTKHVQFDELKDLMKNKGPRSSPPQKKQKQFGQPDDDDDQNDAAL